MDIEAASRPRPIAPAAPDPAVARQDAAAAARAFEALVIEQVLAGAGRATLGDDLLGTGGLHVRQLADRLRAEMMARAAPFGLEKLLEPPR